jgi:hypothetical protein
MLANWETKIMLYDLSKLPSFARDLIEGSPKWRKLFSTKPKRLLAVGADAKTIKGEKKNVMTAILYLTPANGSGVNMCANAALAGCIIACLFTAGRGAMQNVEFARLRKTLFFLQYREEFLAMLHAEIVMLQRKASKRGMLFRVRLNGTSDIRWELLGVMQAHPETSFYDYTKLANRVVPSNYDLTFSYSGVAAFQRQVDRAVAAGMRIAVVFRTRAMVEAMLAVGERFLGLELVDGDDSDNRPDDAHGVVVALYAKGKAKHDATGFVVG